VGQVANKLRHKVPPNIVANATVAFATILAQLYWLVNPLSGKISLAGKDFFRYDIYKERR
jgi:hypothetical protein